MAGRVKIVLCRDFTRYHYRNQTHVFSRQSGMKYAQMPFPRGISTQFNLFDHVIYSAADQLYYQKINNMDKWANLGKGNASDAKPIEFNTAQYTEYNAISIVVKQIKCLNQYHLFQSDVRIFERADSLVVIQRCLKGIHAWL